MRKRAPRMPEEPAQQKAPSRRWRPNDFFRQSALEAVRRNAGMSTGHAREEAVGLHPGGLDPFARRDLGRDVGRHLELGLNSLTRNSLTRRIGITGRFLSSLPPIFHASTLDLPGLVDDDFEHVTIEIVDPPEVAGGNASPEPSVSNSDEDRPFGTYSSDSDWSDSDSACDKTEKASHDSKPKATKARQSSRHAGLGLADLDHSESSTTRKRGSPTFRCAMPADLETLFEVDQSSSSDSDVDILSDSDTFNTDSSDEWEVDVRKSNRRTSFRFQSMYSGPPNSEEEDGIEVLDVEVRGADRINADDTEESDETEGENREENREVQRDAKEEMGIILEEDEEEDDESDYRLVEDFLRSIEGSENEEEDEVDEDNQPTVDEDKVQRQADRDEETGEEVISDFSLEEEETDEYAEDEHGQNTRSENEGSPSFQDKEPFERELELGYDSDDIDDKDDATIENDTTIENNPDESTSEEEEATTEEIEDPERDDDVFAAIEELPPPDVDVVNE